MVLIQVKAADNRIIQEQLNQKVKNLDQLFYGRPIIILLFIMLFS